MKAFVAYTFSRTYKNGDELQRDDCENSIIINVIPQSTEALRKLEQGILTGLQTMHPNDEITMPSLRVVCALPEPKDGPMPKPQKNGRIFTGR